MELMSKEGKQAGSGIAEAGACRSDLAGLLDELAHGVVLTTGTGRMLHANQSARHELARAGALALSDAGAVQACSPECDRELQAAIARAAAGRRSLAPDLYALGDSAGFGPATFENSLERFAAWIESQGLPRGVMPEPVVETEPEALPEEAVA